MKKIVLFAVFFVIYSATIFASTNIYALNSDNSKNNSSEIVTSEKQTPEYTGPCKGTFDGGFSWVYDKESRELIVKGKGLFPIPLFDIFKYQIVIESSDCRVDPWDRIEYPSIPLVKTLRIEDGITGFFDKHPVEILNSVKNGVIFNTEIGTDIEKLIVGKDLSDIPVSASKEYSVSNENPYFASYDKSLYTKDYRKLLKRPTKHDGALKLHPNLEIIGDGALSNSEFGSARVPESVLNGYVMVIPWGVTTVEGTLTSKYDMQAVIVPDTLRNFNSSMDASWYNATYFVSQNHYDYCIEKYGIEVTPFEEVLDQSYVDRFSNLSKKDYYDYYGIKPNSLKTFQNGKTYYFDSNYKMAKGWTKVKNTWYYFNDYGAAVVKIWLKSGGKWYYLQEDGTMATNKWIKWYNKWYYVGKDGAMYANRKTPDGYYVNASGVWVK